MARPLDNPAPLLIGLAVLGLGLLALNLPDRSAAAQSAQAMPRHTLAYPGAEGVTILALDLDPSAEARAGAALDGVAFHAAYAEGPEGRSGLWTAAHTVELAHQYALAACGEGCRVLAERRPLHAPEAPGIRTLIVQPEMARRIGLRGPFIREGNSLAIGGAGAWGTGHAGGRVWGGQSADARALDECEARRRAEPTPAGVVSPPCRTMRLRDAEITDLRPETSLYPAPFTIDLATLVAVGRDDLRMVHGDGSPFPGANQNGPPIALHGARASNGIGRDGIIDRGGWPEVAASLALALCEADRRFADPPCTVATRRMPRAALPDGTLAVTPEILDGFRAWQDMDGAGAFAIGPLGAWGSSRGFATLEEARQSAADWCAYHGRRGNTPFWLRRAFIELPPCRIVAERGP